MEGKGTAFALLTAVISGFSIFVNSFGVKTIEPFLYTMLKNLGVAFALLSALLLLNELEQVQRLTRRQWLGLVVIGVVGGSVPFLLFFYGLSIASAATASFIYRLLFIFAAVLGVWLLRERASKEVVVGGFVALVGNIFLLGGMPKFGFGETLVLVATAMWAVEYYLSKRLLAELSPRIVALGRMGFGAIVLIAATAYTGSLFTVPQLTALQWQWVGISVGFLTAFVLSWYAGLKHARLTTATAILTLGGPITYALSVAFAGKALAPLEAFGFLLLVAGIAVMVGMSTWAGAFTYVRREWLSVVPWKE